MELVLSQSISEGVLFQQGNEYYRLTFNELSLIKKPPSEFSANSKKTTARYPTSVKLTISKTIAQKTASSTDVKELHYSLDEILLLEFPITNYNSIRIKISFHKEDLFSLSKEY
ncbi:hypothetical protein [Coxiella-like endosymbiont]|uniref:hypothetical protein n=1 Tax=Coxiella-like endosymbiont TaxID=1592897 RepID=UPI00272C700C|nr:hypothetical protein [Coxiella-like endosymbiont]